MESTIKTIRLLSAAALLVFAAAACKQEEIGDPEPEILGPRVLRIQATAPSVTESAGDTKVDIASDGGTFTWSATDAIAVCSSTGSYTTFILDEGAGTGSGVFANEFDGTRAHYAVYPASIVDAGNYDSPLKVNLPTGYSIDNSMSDWRTYYSTFSPLPMVASNPSSGALAFRHVGGIFRITLNSVPQNTKSIVVTMDKNIAGSFTVNSPGTSGNYIANNEGSSKAVTYTLANALAANTDGIVLNLPVPVGNGTHGTTYGSLNVVCKNSSSTSLSSATVDITRSFDRAGGRKIALDCSASDSRLANFTLNNLTVSPGTAQRSTMTYSATNLSSGSVTGVSGFSVSASSSDETVATVSVSSNTITVTGLKNGTATITATAQLGNDKITKTATVTVLALGSATITPSSTGVQVSKTVTLTAGLTNASSTSITADSYAWSITSGSELASLSSTSGSSVTLTANTNTGSVTVQCVATAGNLTKTATQTITISKATVSLAPTTTGQTDISSNTNMTLRATAANLGTATVSSWSWTSGTTSVATLSYTTGTSSTNDATVTFAGAGSSVITATATLSDGSTVSNTFTVYGRTLTITGDAGVGNNNTGATGEVAKKTLTSALSSGTASTYSWSSSATGVVTVAGNTSLGTLTYVSAGTSTITATIVTAGKATVTGTKSITAHNASLSGDSSVKVGNTITLTPSISNSGTLSGSWSWSSSNDSYATVSDGTVTGVATGDVTITATANTTDGASVKATKAVNVFNKATISSVAITGTTGYNVGGTGTLTATPTYSGDGDKTTTYAWTVTSGSAVSITSGANTASVSITASSSTGTATLQCTVTCANSVFQTQTVTVYANTTTLSSVKSAISASNNGSTYLGYYVTADGNVYSDSYAAPSGTIGRIAYINNDGVETSSNASGTKILVLATSNVGSYQWKTSNSSGESDYNSTSALNGLAFCETHNNSTYPAAQAAYGWSTSKPSGSTNWFLPSYAQLNNMLTVAKKSGTGQITSGRYWSATENASLATYAWFYNFNYSEWSFSSKDGNRFPVRACFAYYHTSTTPTSAC